MSDTKVKIIDAALEIFSRYGLRRVTMGDVAETAGISRQTLYAHVQNKDELITAVMTEAYGRLMNDVFTEWSNSTDIARKIDVYLEHAILKPYRVMQQNPELKEILNGPAAGSTENVHAAKVAQAQRVAEQFAPFDLVLRDAGTTPENVALFLVRTASELKYSAQSEEDLTGLLNTLKASVLALLGNPSP